MSFVVRDFHAGEHAVLATIFTRAVHELACEQYTRAQCAAWAPLPPDQHAWQARCERKQPFVAVGEQGVIAGFLELDPDGHVDCTYVNPDFARRGVMSLLLRHAEAVCRKSGLNRMYAEVSLCARPFFEHHGWIRLADNLIHRGDVVLTNTNMQKHLQSPASLP